jgi:hypothetical protein
MFNNVFSNPHFYDIMWKKKCRAGQATDGNIAHVHCMLDNQGYKHKLILYNIFTSVLLQRLHEPASMLRYTHIASVVSLIEDSHAK